MLYLRSGPERVLTTKQRKFSVVMIERKVVKENNTVLISIWSVSETLERNRE